MVELEQSEVKHCGIIMPIAAMPTYTAEHWAEVKSIITEATEIVDGINFKTEIVSNSDGEIDVIHKRIIQNIYNADIVICDISGRNPNVLFELGMRLTFDKPTILIKDDETDFIFDTGVIEHLTYPKDLRFSKVVSFKKELARRIKVTYEASINNPDFSTFLKSFGEYKVPSLDQTTVSDVNQVILDELNTLRRELTSFKKEAATASPKNLNVIPRGLKEVVFSYVNETNDWDTPELISDKEEFIHYIASNGIDPFKLNRKVIIEYLNQARTANLPF